MILYLRDPNNSNKELIDVRNTFGKITEYKINIKNQ
jgi:hypothetical protein